MRAHWLLFTIALTGALTGALAACNISDDAPLLGFPVAGESCDDEGETRGEFVCRDGAWTRSADEGPDASASDTDTDTDTDTGSEPEPDAATTPDDAGTDDAGTDDAGTDDAGTDDAGTDDAGTDDAGSTESPCTDGTSCPSGVCDLATSTCAEPDCDDGVKKGDETDIDCGGSCGPCMPGQGCMVKLDCGIDTAGDWGACVADGAPPCDDQGVRSRTVTTRSCEDDVCVQRSAEESEPCTYDSDGDTCASTTEGTWSNCLAPDRCVESGTQTRQITDYVCDAGACEPLQSSEARSCTRSTDGNPCVTDDSNPGECSSGTCAMVPFKPCLDDRDCASTEYCTSQNYCCGNQMLCPI